MHKTQVTVINHCKLPRMFCVVSDRRPGSLDAWSQGPGEVRTLDLSHRQTIHVFNNGDWRPVGVEWHYYENVGLDEEIVYWRARQANRGLRGY